jgi:hypothetical protein
MDYPETLPRCKVGGGQYNLLFYALVLYFTLRTYIESYLQNQVQPDEFFVVMILS